MSDEDEITTLLERMGRDDRAALDRLYTISSGQLFAVCLQILTQRNLAEAALQDSYVRIWDNAQYYQPGAFSPLIWLITLTRRTAVEHLRRAIRHAVKDADPIEAPADAAPLPVLSVSAVGAISGGLADLPATQGTAIRLAYLEAFSYGDLATQFDLPTADMRRSVRRGLAHLRSYLQRVQGGRMSQIAQEDAIQAAEYALGLQSAAEQARLEARMARNEALQEETIAWEVHLAHLALTLPPVDPPAAARIALMQALFSGASQPAWWRQLGLLRALVGAALAAGLLWLAVTMGWLVPDVPPPGSSLDVPVTLDGAVRTV